MVPVAATVPTLHLQVPETMHGSKEECLAHGLCLQMLSLRYDVLVNEVSLLSITDLGLVNFRLVSRSY